MKGRWWLIWTMALLLPTGCSSLTYVAGFNATSGGRPLAAPGFEDPASSSAPRSDFADTLHTVEIYAFPIAFPLSIGLSPVFLLVGLTSGAIEGPPPTSRDINGQKSKPPKKESPSSEKIEKKKEKKTSPETPSYEIK